MYLSLNSPVEDIAGVGPSLRVKLEVLGIITVRDLLLHFPRDYEDLRDIQSIATLVMGQKNSLRCTIEKLFKTQYQGKRGLQQMTKAIVSDESGSMEITWFGKNYIERKYSAGDSVYLTGMVKAFKGKLSMTSPEVESVGRSAQKRKAGSLSPVYRETQGLGSKKINDLLRKVIDTGILGAVEDSIPEDILKSEGLIPLAMAVRELHFPTGNDALLTAENRVAFQELFLLQLGNMINKKVWTESDAERFKVIDCSDVVMQEMQSLLPFDLTMAQNRVMQEIMTDLQSGRSMLRLLEGDVGSGKTIIAFLASLLVIRSGYQSTILAPTEILAKQHADAAVEFFADTDVSVAFLSSSVKGKARKEVLKRLKDGEINLLIGTHAVLTDEVVFKELGLSVVDEQHRFGVDQRAKLKERFKPHMLAMTATPIPRTLAMTIFGDLDLSILDELPPGRKPINTKVIPPGKRNKMNEFISAVVAKGQQVFVVCPLIEESENMQAKNVTEHTDELQGIFPNLQVCMMHGKLKSADKQDIMNRFSAGEINILVSTSVIEVGVNVPNATVMVIEGAERFGLAQLHQFRGRVGRGAEKSYCLLCSESNSGSVTSRLDAMTNCENGFELAEVDLKIRGPGEVFGTRQSGLPDLRMASLTDKVLISRVSNCLNSVLSSYSTEDLFTLHTSFEAGLLKQKGEVAHMQ